MVIGHPTLKMEFWDNEKILIHNETFWSMERGLNGAISKELIVYLLKYDDILIQVLFNSVEIFLSVA